MRTTRRRAGRAGKQRRAEAYHGMEDGKAGLSDQATITGHAMSDLSLSVRETVDELVEEAHLGIVREIAVDSRDKMARSDRDPRLQTGT